MVILLRTLSMQDQQAVLEDLFRPESAPARPRPFVGYFRDHGPECDCITCWGGSALLSVDQAELVDSSDLCPACTSDRTVAHESPYVPLSTRFCLECLTTFTNERR